MLLGLPVGAFCAIAWSWYRSGKEWRDSLLAAATVCGAYTFAVTELLSVPGLLTRVPIAAAWALLLAGAAVAAHRTPPARRAARVPLARDELALLLGAAVLSALLGLATVSAAPNTWDAMMYHLPRVVRWLDEGSVALYPTIDYQQLNMPPWHEYGMLHAHALWGGDRFDAAVSLVSALGSALAVSRIADSLGAGRRSQIIAAIVCLTIPQGVLCASSPKNEWALAFWLAVAASSAFRWKSEPGAFHALMAGAALGLACGTKGTAFMYAPLLLLGVAASWDRPAWRRFARWVPVVAALALLPIVPGALRNRELSGSFLATSHVGAKIQDAKGRDEYSVAHVTPSGTAAGIVRYLSLHMGTPVGAINRRTEALLAGVMRAMGSDPDDADAMIRGKSTHIVFPFHINATSRHEIQAGNPWHLALFVGAMIGLAMRPRNTAALLLGAGLAAAFVALATFVRWQPFSARLHLPLMAIAGAPIALWMERWPSKLAVAAAALLLLAALPFAMKNDLRPLVTARAGAVSAYATESVFVQKRELEYFSDNHKDLAPAWIAAAHAVDASGCRDVGLDADNFYTYPMFALLGAGTERHVRYLNVDNQTASFERPGLPAPCAVVCFHCATEPSRQAPYASYGTPSVFGDLALFLRR
jgi:hypothetical protein